MDHDCKQATTVLGLRLQNEAIGRIYAKMLAIKV